VNRACLGDVAEFINGVAFKPEDWHDSGLPIIRIQNLTDPSKPINYTTRVVSDKYRVKRGDLLVSWSATLGVFKWDRTDEALVNQHIFRVLPNSKLVDDRFLRHMLLGALRSMERHLHGATMQHVNRGEFLSTEIPLPPLDEQHAIAAILDEAEALRDKRIRAQSQLEHLSESIFIDMFGNLEEEPLGENLTFITSGGRGWAKYYAAAGEPFLRSLDVRMGSVSTDDLAQVEAPDNAEARRTRTRVGDVLLTITGSQIGRAAPLPNDLAGAYVSQHVAILRPAESSLLPEFLAAFLCSTTFGQRQISAAQYGQTKPGLNFEQIRKFRIPAADVARQSEFRTRMSVVRRLASKFDSAERELDDLSNSLQDLAFSGHLKTSRG
jgi:type I restriction enzyme S subunit